MADLVTLPRGFFWRVDPINNEPGNVTLYLMKKSSKWLPARRVGYASGSYQYGFHYSYLGEVSSRIWNEYLEEQIAVELGGNYPPKVWSEQF